MRRSVNYTISQIHIGNICVGLIPENLFGKNLLICAYLSFTDLSYSVTTLVLVFVCILSATECTSLQFTSCLLCSFISKILHRWKLLFCIFLQCWQTSCCKSRIKVTKLQIPSDFVPLCTSLSRKGIQLFIRQVLRTFSGKISEMNLPFEFLSPSPRYL